VITEKRFTFERVYLEAFPRYDLLISAMCRDYGPLPTGKISTQSVKLFSRYRLLKIFRGQLEVTLDRKYLGTLTIAFFILCPNVRHKSTFDESFIDVDHPDFEKSENNTSFLGVSISDRFRDIAYKSWQSVEVNVI
jgi:hypothetical protein